MSHSSDGAVNTGGENKSHASGNGPAATGVLKLRTVVIAAAVLLAAFGGWGLVAHGADVDFNRDVRPLLSAKDRGKISV